MAAKDHDLEEPLELGPEVTSFLRGLAKNLDEEEKASSPEPLVKELHEWVAWKDESCKIPDWWRELLAVLEMPNCKSTGLISSSQKVKWGKQNGKLLSGPPAPPCLLRNSFQLPPDSIFTCQDIQEMKREKTVAYPMPSSIGWRRLTHLLKGDHACWPRVWRSCRERLGATSASQMRMFLKV